MARALMLQHVAFEVPDRLDRAFAAAGYDSEVRRLDLGAELPTELAPGDVLVVLGGPMGVADLGSASFPFLEPEVQLLRKCLAADAPVLGICLGAQLLAHAAGARVYPAMRAAANDAEPERAYEVGWAPVRFHGIGTEPALAGLSAQEMMLHWHGDTFDLPAGARLLASTDTCPHQAFRIGTRSFGLQFHCELSRDSVARWLEMDDGMVVRANGPDGPARLRAETARYFSSYEAVGDRLLGNLVAALAARG